MPLGSLTKRFRRSRLTRGEGSASSDIPKHEVLPQLLYSAQDEASESTHEEQHAHLDEHHAPPTQMPTPMLVMPDAPDIAVDVEVTQPIPAYEPPESAPLPEEPLEELSRLGQEIDRHYSKLFPSTFHQIAYLRAV